MDACFGGLQCLLQGVRDSVFGIWPVYLLVKRNEKIRKQILQCFLLNGAILWLSILLFDYFVLPLIQIIAGSLYSVISNPTESGVLAWLGTILWYVFTGFWVLPLFWISKPINSIWFQDIASTAFEETKRQELKKRRIKPWDSLSLGRNVSRLIADMLFSVVVELLFLVQSTIVGCVPGVGYLLSLLHMAMLYSLYSFEYKWINEGRMVHQRVAYVERQWPYFLGFGLPLAILTTLTESIFISACIFGVLFPLVLVSANYATPTHTSLSPVPIFKVAVMLSNRLFNRSSSIPSSSRPSTSMSS